MAERESYIVKREHDGLPGHLKYASHFWNHTDAVEAIGKWAKEHGVERVSLQPHPAFRFNEPGVPMVDYYPSTGRWRMVEVGAGATCGRGNVKKFLSWYGELRRKALSDG